MQLQFLIAHLSICARCCCRRCMLVVERENNILVDAIELCNYIHIVDAPKMRWFQLNGQGLMLKMMAETVLMWMLGGEKRKLY